MLSRPSKGRWLVLPVLLALLQACGRPKPLPPRPGPRPERVPAAQPLRRLGWSIQAGAFAQVENAARLANALQAKGLDATYFASEKGLYKVRFGDFATRDEARKRAEGLKKAGVIEAYYLVQPAPLPPVIEPGKSGDLRAALVATAESYLGLPYLWGGTTTKGFDCSGLTQAVYRLNGLILPRSSREQMEEGRKVELEDLKAGDLVFFSTDGSGMVSHVGIYVGGGQFIHATGQRRGICRDRLEERYFRDRYMGGRTYL